MSRPDLSLKRPATEPVAEPEADQYDDSEAPQLMNVGEHGNISYVDIHSLEQYLDAAPDKAEALEIIIADISDIIENEESFKEWTSEVHDLVARKQYWEGGKYSTLKSWQADHLLFLGAAKQGRAIRNKTKSAIDGLVANGVSGPRFECMVRRSSRTFIEAVRKQVDMHSFSYPLVCALANVKAFHRLKSGGKGRKGAHTQTHDVADLDSIIYRKLSATELKSIKAKVGAHGFLEEADAEEEAILDVEFDEATQAFAVGKGGFDQPEEHGKAQPKIMQQDGDKEDQPPAKKVKVKKRPETFNIHKFSYITDCTCSAEAPQAIRSSLDKLTGNCGYNAIATIMPAVLQSCDMLCPRHCQLTLVKALGRDHLIHKTDRQSLQAEVRELIPKLEYYIKESSTSKARFDSYKKSIGFSWDLIEAISAVNVSDVPDVPFRNVPQESKDKRKRTRQ